jgi:hypothetical protein
MKPCRTCSCSTALGALLLLSALAAEARELVIGAEEWARPRHGEVLVEMPPVRHAMAALRSDSQAKLLIHHPEGEAGMLWALELQSWLFALGLPQERVATVPSSARADAVYLEIRAGHTP